VTGRILRGSFRADGRVTTPGALALEPNPPDAFIRGDYRRLRVGVYRVMYVVEDDIITIERVDLVV
jgi:hypothetical protein